MREFEPRCRNNQDTSKKFATTTKQHIADLILWDERVSVRETFQCIFLSSSFTFGTLPRLKWGFTNPQCPGPITPANIGFTAARPYQAKANAEWALSHPMSSVNYGSYLIMIQARDSASISVKISYPNSPSQSSSSLMEAAGSLAVTFPKKHGFSGHSTITSTS